VVQAIVLVVSNDFRRLWSIWMGMPTGIREVIVGSDLDLLRLSRRFESAREKAPGFLGQWLTSEPILILNAPQY
jgi:hypothetical protein